MEGGHLEREGVPGGLEAELPLVRAGFIRGEALGVPEVVIDGHPE